MPLIRPSARWRCGFRRKMTWRPPCMLRAMCRTLTASTARGGVCIWPWRRLWHRGWGGVGRERWWWVRAALAAPERVAGVGRAWTARPDFDWKNPNRFRSVLGALSGNHAGFHHGAGAGYAVLADWLIKLDPLNPQTAARMSTAFETWPRYDADRQALMRGALQRIMATDGLSRDLSEMAGRMLGA